MWSARTATRVTAAAFSTAPPGTTAAVPKDVAVATSVASLCTPTVRPGA